MNLSSLFKLAALSLSIATCLLSGQSVGAAEKVSARTVKETPDAKDKESASRAVSIADAEIPSITLPTSTFVADFIDSRGRDPFFPRAEYLSSQKPKAITPDPVPVMADASLLDPLRITGVGGVGEKRWAMINGTTLYLGESATLQISGKAYAIECIAMDATSITIGVKGNAAIRRKIKLD